MRWMNFALMAVLAVSLSAHETGFPEETLKKVFPNATGFTSRKKTLTTEQLKRVEQRSGSEVHANDNPLTFYVALGKSADGSGVLGTVVMVDAKGPKGLIDLAVGFNRDGSLHQVVIAENADDPALNSNGLLDQLTGKTIQAPLTVGQDIQYSGNPKSAQTLLNAVRRAMYLLQAASGQ